MLVTNFKKDRLPLYNKALKFYIKETGDKSLYIDRNAYIRGGIKDEDMCALRCTEQKELGLFWNIFDSIDERKIINKE